MTSTSFTSTTYNFGDKHGSWTSTKSLGAGAFGKVELVTNSQKQLAAVKIVNLSAMKAEDRAAAQHEVTLMSSKLPPHPNIIRYYASYEKDGNLYILLEYADRGDLAKLIEKYCFKNEGNDTGLPEAVVGSIFTQLVSAVHFLHSRKILHRDLKTANVFLASASSSPLDRSHANLVVKLGDFGISTVLRTTFQLKKTVCGTPYYFSPELCLSRPYNNKSDVWSLGIILFELVTGKKCFDANNLKALMCRILKGNYPPIDTTKYSRTIQDVIDGMLQQKVEKRFSMRQVVEMEFVKRYLSGTVTTGNHDNVRNNYGNFNFNSNNIPSSNSPLAKGPNNNMIINPTTSKAMHEARSGKPNPSRVRYQQMLEAARAGSGKAGGAKTEPMKYIKRRVELASYEDQQQYVNRGRDYVQQVREQQEGRMRVHDSRSARITELRRQLQEIEKRHNDIKNERYDRIDARNNQGPSRSDEYYSALRSEEEEEKRRRLMLQQQQQQLCSNSLTPRAEPSAAELAKFYRNRQSVDSPWYRGEGGGGEQKHHLHLQLQGSALLNFANNNGKPSALPPSAVVPDSKFRGKRDLKQFIDVDQVLTNESNAGSLNPEEAERAKELWRMHKEKIEVARQLEEQEKQAEMISKHKKSQATWKKPRGVDDNQNPRVSSKLSNRRQNDDDEDFEEEEEEEHEEHEEEEEDGEEEKELDDEEDVTERLANLYNEDWSPEDEQRVQNNLLVEATLSRYSSHDSHLNNNMNSSPASNANLFYNPYFDPACDDEDLLRQQLKDQCDFFEDAPNPTDVISAATNMHLRKFTLDGKTLKLPGISENSTNQARAAALREFLIHGLGGSQELFDDIYNRLRGIELAPTISEAERLMQNLEKATNKSQRLIDLMIQLRVVEATSNA